MMYKHTPMIDNTMCISTADIDAIRNNNGIK